MRRVSGYAVQLIREDDGGFHVFVPALPGCGTYGKTRKQAMVMIEDAIRLYVETLDEIRSS